jgi:hypothetical protein
VEKTGTGNFLPYANLGTIGQQKRLLTYKRTDSTAVGIVCVHTVFEYYTYGCMVPKEKFFKFMFSPYKWTHYMFMYYVNFMQILKMISKCSTQY